jgi:hypothetical protein
MYEGKFGYAFEMQKHCYVAMKEWMEATNVSIGYFHGEKMICKCFVYSFGLFTLDQCS